MKVILSGCSGHMGNAVTRLASGTDSDIICGVDSRTDVNSVFSVYSSFSDIPDSMSADVIIDFSHPTALTGILRYAMRTNTPAVLCTTGYTEEQIAAIAKCSESIALFRSANMSLGVQVLAALCRQAAAILGSDFDIEIIEKHHRRKLDAPSGTALFLADEISGELNNKTELVFDRHERRMARPQNEIGISSIRGGTIVGEHEVLFSGTDETLELKHTALSRDNFAAGALRAARFMCGKSTGLYTMQDMLKDFGL